MFRGKSNYDSFQACTIDVDSLLNSMLGNNLIEPMKSKVAPSSQPSCCFSDC